MLGPVDVSTSRADGLEFSEVTQCARRVVLKEKGSNRRKLIAEFIGLQSEFSVAAEGKCPKRPSVLVEDHQQNPLLTSVCPARQPSF
jgi:hypothetical protein